MKRLIFLAMMLASVLSTNANAIDFWHSSTVWAGQGQCSAVFSFDSGMEEFNNLQVYVSVLNKDGKTIASDVLEIERFGGSSAERYDQAFLEGEEICEDDLTIMVNKAIAVLDGKPTDLLENGTISAREFKPFKILFGKSLETSKQTEANRVFDEAAADVANDYEAQWLSIRENPAQYLDDCQSGERSLAMELGGMESADAEKEAKKTCNRQIVDLKKCMDEPSATAQTCFQNVMESGD